MNNSMTPERAIEIITNAIQSGVITDEKDRALATAQKALEKQIPKKPLIKTHTYSGLDDDFTNKYYCPVCNELIVCEDTNGYYAGKIVEHCPCGQALDWSDER